MSSTSNPEPDLRDRGIGELMKQLAGETSTLVRQELDLAKAEMSQKGKQAGKGVGIIGAGGVVALMALGALTAFLVALLATAVDHTWLAALIVAVVLGAVAGVLALTGKKEVQEATPPVPEQTVETVKEDVEWAKTQTPSGRR